MLLTDIFSSDAFKLDTLTDSINRIPVMPTYLQQLGIFRERGITTTSIQIDSEDGLLTLVPNTERGAPGNQLRKRGRKTRNFSTCHFPVEQTIMAAEIQNIRAFGGTELEGVQTRINSFYEDAANSLDTTIEYQRLGAVKGIILDADGSTVLTNLFTEFGVSQETVDFALTTSGTEVEDKCREVNRLIREAIGGGQVVQRVVCFCGKGFFESLLRHPSVKEKRLNSTSNLMYGNMMFGNSFTWGGIEFVEYYGTVGGVQFVADNEGYAFATGVNGLFETVYAPGDFMDTVNTPGRPRYAAVERVDYNRGIKMLAESNPFSFCRKPKSLIKVIRED